MQYDRFISLGLRVALAISFLYPPVAALIDPISWVSYFPAFLRDGVGNDMLLLHAFGVIEVIIAFWLLSGWRVWIPSALAAVMLFAIVLFNFGQFAVLFRDVSLGILALVLVYAEWYRHAPKTEQGI